MAGVRGWFCGLIVALCGFGSVYAQSVPFTCNTSVSVAPIVRAEGYTEQVGDLVLNCVGGTPTAASALVPQVSFTIFLNTNITSRVTAANIFSEALLLVDEPNSALAYYQSQTPHPVLNCGQTGAPDNGPGLCAIVSTGNPASTYDGTANSYGGNGDRCDGGGGRPAANSYGCGRPNAFQGRVGSLQDSGQYNAVTFLSVPVDPPGAGVFRTFRFANIRANAAGIGVSTTFTTSQIQMNIASSAGITVAIFNPQQVAAYVNPGLTFDTSSLSTLSSSVRFKEGFASSWKTKNISFSVGDHSGIGGNATYSFATGAWTYNGGTRYPADVAQNVPGPIYNTESAFQWQNNSTNAPPTSNPPPGFGLPPGGVSNQGAVLNSQGFGGLDTGIRNAGVAGAGTRLALRFTGVPGGASVLVPSVVYLFQQSCTGNCQTGVMVLTSTDDAGAGPFTPATAATVAVGNLAVYEILYGDPYSLEYADIPCQLTTGQSLPLAGVQVSGTFAPFYSSVGAGQPTPNAAFSTPTAVPRFGLSVNCTYALAPPSQSFTASGGVGNVAVITQTGCGWSVAYNPPWIVILDGYGAGSGGANYSVGANPGSTPRSATLLIADKMFTVTQEGSSNQAPTNVSVTPGSGSGSSQTFSFVYSDANGFTDLPWTQVNINSVLSAVNSCYVHYDRLFNAAFLINDAGTSWQGPLILGVSGTIQNSQCIVNGGSSTASGSGNNLTVSLALTFKSPFAGTKSIYMRTQDTGGLGASWQTRGSWTVIPTVNGSPLAVAVAPASGSGSSQTFSFWYSDPNGFTDLAWTQVNINSVLSAVNACYVHYDRLSNAAFLVNDAGTVWQGPLILGIPGTIQNGQCSLNGGSSSVSGSGNNLTVNLALTFTSAFAGAKTTYMQTQDAGGLGTGWQTRGSWTATAGGNLPPTAVSVTPASGAGSSPVFSFLYSDQNGFIDLRWMQVNINSVLGAVNACYVHYYQLGNAAFLLDDSGTHWLGPIYVGDFMTSVQNSQCVLSSSGYSTFMSGANLTVNLPLTFKPAFAGPKTVYMQTQDLAGLGTGWQARGSWTVP